MKLCDQLMHGHVIPALPLALEEDGRWSERHQRALVRYYVASGAGGLAVAVHSTQFAIREPQHDLFRPVLELAAETIRDSLSHHREAFVPVAGACGRTPQAVREAETAAGFGYEAVLVSPGAWRDDTEDALIDHCQEVSGVLPVIGFYLQPAVGGRMLSRDFWRRFCEIPGVVAIKIAPFDRYRTLDVLAGLADSGRTDIALYTGNDDNIIVDLLTPFPFGKRERFISGGLLGQWGVWTRRAVEMLEALKIARTKPKLDTAWLTRNAALTEANAAIFDSANGFRGCIPGILEVLRREGLVPSVRCLDPDEVLSPRQAEAITRVTQTWPWLTDSSFVREHLDSWLS